MNKEKKDRVIPILTIATIFLVMYVIDTMRRPTPEPKIIRETKYVTKVVKQEPTYDYEPVIETTPAPPSPAPPPVIDKPKEPKRSLLIYKKTPVYTRPSISSGIMGTLRPNDNVPLNNSGKQLFEKSLWVPVLVDGMPGWIYEGYIQIGRR